MKISAILKNLELGQAVPDFIGTIVSISPVKTIAAKGENPEYKTQSITFCDSEKEEIRVLLKAVDESKYIHEDSIGQVYEFICKKSHNGALTGVVFKEGKNDKFLCVTSHATINRVADLEVVETVETPSPETFDKDLTPETQSTEKQAVGESDKEIKRYTRERLYIYDMVVSLVGESGSSFPIEKAPEIATGIHIDLSRQNANILPRVAPKQLFVKTPAERPRAEAKSEPENKAPDDWRSSRNPKTGQKLGEMSKDEAVKQYMTLYFRERKAVMAGGEIERVKFFTSLGNMFKEYGIKTIDAVTAYVGQYIEAFFEQKKIKTKVTTLLVKQKISAYMKFTGVKDEEVTPAYLEELMKDKEAISAIAKFDETKNKRTS